MYDLYRTTQLVEIFRSRNLFWYLAEAGEWLTTCDKVIALANKLREVHAEILRDEEATENILVSRSGAVEKILVDQVVLGAALQTGYRTTIPSTMVPEHWPEYAPAPPPGQRLVVGGIHVEQEDRVEEWSQYRQELIKAEITDAVREMSVLWILLKGVRRKRLKIEHNLLVLEKVLFERLLVSTARIREYMHDLVFKGAWEDNRQALLNRIVKTFVGDVRWSSYSKSLGTEFAAIEREFRWIGTPQGQRLSLAVEYAIRYAGGVAA